MLSLMMIQVTILLNLLAIANSLVDAMSSSRHVVSVNKNSAALVASDPDMSLPGQLCKSRFVTSYDAL